MAPTDEGVVRRGSGGNHADREHSTRRADAGGGGESLAAAGRGLLVNAPDRCGPDGRSPAAVSNLSELLDWPAEEVAIADSKARSMGHARALLAFGDDGKRVRLAGSVTERTLAVRATETRARKALEGKGRAPPAPPPKLSAVTEVLRTPEVRVQLQQRSGGPGKFILEFPDTDSRDTINAVIKAAIPPSTSRSGKTGPAFRQPSTLA